MNQLFLGTHGSAIRELVWEYMAYGPFEMAEDMQRWLEERAASDDPLFFTVHHHESQRRVGMASFLNIAPEMRRLELGHIWYAADAQGTQANSEAVYLMLCEAFDKAQLPSGGVEVRCSERPFADGGSTPRLQL